QLVRLFPRQDRVAKDHRGEPELPAFHLPPTPSRKSIPRRVLRNGLRGQHWDDEFVLLLALHAGSATAHRDFQPRCDQSLSTQQANSISYREHGRLPPSLRHPIRTENHLRPSPLQTPR